MSKKVQKRGINQRQRLAALLISSGVTQRKVAEIVGVGEKQVSRWKHQEAFRKLLREKSAELENEVAKARDILIEGAVLAALKELDSLKSEDETVALRAAGEILDRVGIGKTSKVEQITDSVIKLAWKDGGNNDNQAIPTPGATGDPPEQGQVQSRGGGQEVREDQAGSD